MIKKNSICAVVVTYNRKELLLECLNALKNQTVLPEAIYIVDNASTDGTFEFLRKHHYVKSFLPNDFYKEWEISSEVKTSQGNIKVYYLKLPKNIGGAGGFYKGLKEAYRKGYSWFWLMDDDAEPERNALEALKIFLEKKNYNVYAVASKVVFPDYSICFNHRGIADLKNVFPMIQKPLSLELYKKEYVEIDIASFVGLMISRKVIDKIGFPKKEFFIHHDDVEFCLRFNKYGKIYLVNNSVIIHKAFGKKGTKKRFLGKEVYRIPFSKYWLVYYGHRNLTWVGKKYTKNYVKFWKDLLKMFIGNAKDILLYDDKKFLRIKLLLNAYLDGLKGIFDNEKPKRILYKDKTLNER